jgi:hypothetical protein
VLNRKKEPSEKESIFFRGRCFFSLPARRLSRSPFFWRIGGTRPLMGDPIVFLKQKGNKQSEIINLK